MKNALGPVPDELRNCHVRAAWYAVLPQRVVGQLAHTLATSVPQTSLEGRAAVELLAHWLRGQATPDDCRAGSEAAWAAAVREWARAAPLMDSVTWDSSADDPRAPGDAAAATASAAETATVKYPEAACRADSYVAAILGWPKVRRLLEQEVRRLNQLHHDEQPATPDRPRD
jgi:hypothetical protein